MMNRCKFCDLYYNYKEFPKFNRYGYCTKRCLELYDYELSYKKGFKQVVFEKVEKDEDGVEGVESI